MATEDKSSSVYEIDCSNCKVVYFCQPKQVLKLRPDEHKRSAKNCKRAKLRSTIKKKIKNLTGIKRKSLIGKVVQLLGKSDNLYVLWGILITH